MKTILAGHKFSVPYTRVYALRECKLPVKDHSRANTELFVDDTSMHAKAQTNMEVLNILVAALKQFGALVHKLKLSFSPKAAIVISIMRLARGLHVKLVKYGLKFVVPKLSRDLGITTTAGKSRPSNLQKDRQAKSKNRIVKISNIT